MAGPTPTYKIEYQTQTVGMGPEGKAAEGWKVGYFVESLGVHGSVFVPLARFNAANVKALVAEQLAHHAAVAGLGS
jgi:hypothetical protein